MSDFHDRLRQLIKASDYDYKGLSLAIGQGERYISNLLANKSDPGYSSVIRICSALGVTPNQLSGLNDQISLVGQDIDTNIVSAHAERILTSVTREAHRKLSQRGTKPLLDDVLTWWHQHNGLLSNFETLSEHVDLYRAPEPDARLPDPYLIGTQSLAAVSFGIKTADHLRHLFTTFDKDLSQSVTMAHVQTNKGQPLLSIEEIDVNLPGHSFPLRFVYKRLLLPVRDSGGNRYVLNYSQALE
ncbi:hypothetical protein PEL8287_03381 [Roseovarius litorisediminis]|uniref:HTH cro/C1-type domain-containing protein n=1 Tax=Roseovarius litorisediminis TaxID=1312363 RepID=A0A1Y5TES7_9RHOB|nr:helix-turn-helix transcriptional regulator [Roseovarius litorisediminis]SLN62144.1 hypothetical protein PEL8287_03381 [Roseovarius litorisediminis]